MYDKNTYLAAAAVWDATVGQRFAPAALKCMQRAIDSSWDLYQRQDLAQEGYGHARIMEVVNEQIDRQLDGHKLGADTFRINARNEKLGNYAEVSVITIDEEAKGHLWGVTVMPHKLRIVCLEYGSGVSKMSPIYQLDLETNDDGKAVKFVSQINPLNWKAPNSNRHVLRKILNVIEPYCTKAQKLVTETQYDLVTQLF